MHTINIGSLDQFQYELKQKLNQNILRNKKRKKYNLSKRKSEPLSKKNSFRRFPSNSSVDKHKAYYSKLSTTHQKSTSRSRSNSYVKNVKKLDKNEIPTRRNLEKKLSSVTSSDERATDPISSLMNRFSSLFQRRGSNTNSKTPESKQSPLNQSTSSICHNSCNQEIDSGELTKKFDKVTRELLTLKKYRDGCDEQSDKNEHNN